MAKKKNFEGFSDFEREAMKNRAKELVAESKAGKSRAAGEQAVQAAIAAMTKSEQAIAKRLHTLIKESAPTLLPKTWYGMPAYANNEGKVVCFFQCAGKFKARYSTLGFSDMAQLDEDDMWPTSFALQKLSDKEEKKIIALIKKAIKA